MLSIAVDAMGGDNAPETVLEGVKLALEAGTPADKIVLVGPPEDLRARLDRLNIGSDPRVCVEEATQVVEMHESPAKALRAKRKSSIAVATELVREGEVQAIVSAGHTGATVASTVLKLRSLPHIERPGIATVFPLPSGPFVLLDAGANVDAKPLHLVHYAVMGEVYAQHILGIHNPRVGLLSVGGEALKGNELTKSVFNMLSRVPQLNFLGNVEGHDLFENKVDVVVCDGFVGNVVLKCCESLAGALSHIIKENLQKTFMRKAGAYLSRNAYYELKRTTDADEYGGAPLLGINGVCIIGHGSSSPRGIQNAIRVAGEFVDHQVNDVIVNRVQALGGLKPAAAPADTPSYPNGNTGQPHPCQSTESE